MSTNFTALAIVEQIEQAAVLEQLAEEASELSQAALKLARIIRGDNPTPVTKSKAIENLVEEVADVKNVLCVIEESFLPLPTNSIQSEKITRWADRVFNKSKD